MTTVVVLCWRRYTDQARVQEGRRLHSPEAVLLDGLLVAPEALQRVASVVLDHSDAFFVLRVTPIPVRHCVLDDLHIDRVTLAVVI